MPRPPILPTIDWKSVLDSGVTFADWLARAEFPDHRARMEEALGRFRLDAATQGFLAALPRPVHVVAIAEDWCGDVVRHVPVLEHLASRAPMLRTRYVTRAQHPDLFARYLTNGGEAIPKFVFLSDRHVECGNWGPMPAAHRELIARGKASGDTTGAARKRVSALYAADPDCHETRRELLALIDIASTENL